MATIHVNHNSGDDSTGDGSTSAPYKTAQYGYSQCSAGDTLKLCNGGTAEVLTANFDLATVGTTANIIKIIGVNSDWEDDGTRYEIDGDNAYRIYQHADYNFLYNIDIIKPKNYGFQLANIGGMYNCKVHDIQTTVYNSVYMDKDGFIINCDLSGRSVLFYGEGIVANNYIHDITSDGLYLSHYTVNAQVINNIIGNCTGYGIYTNYGDTIEIIGNTIDGCGKSAIYNGNSNNWAYKIPIMYNRITNNQGFAVEIDTAKNGGNSLFINNATYNNTSGVSNSDKIEQINTLNMSSDGYNDKANGDFTLTDSAEGKDIGCKIGTLDEATNISHISAGALTASSGSGGGSCSGGFGVLF